MVGGESVAGTLGRAVGLRMLAGLLVVTGPDPHTAGLQAAAATEEQHRMSAAGEDIAVAAASAEQMMEPEGTGTASLAEEAGTLAWGKCRRMPEVATGAQAVVSEVTVLADNARAEAGEVRPPGTETEPGRWHMLAEQHSLTPTGRALAEEVVVVGSCVPTTQSSRRCEQAKDSAEETVIGVGEHAGLGEQPAREMNRADAAIALSLQGVMTEAGPWP